MLKKRIIPCLDCKNGRVVKGVQFQNLIDAGSPQELAERYQQDGADEVVILDIGASLEDRATQRETIQSVRSVLSIPLTSGGGVRTLNDIETLLNAGADKVSINSAAVKNPKLITEAAKAFGSQCIVVAIDAKKRGSQWTIVTRSGTKEEGISVLFWSQQIAELGAGELLLTSFDRDGTSLGYDLDLIREVRAKIQIPIIASGGASKTEHLITALQAGADAVLAASIFHFGKYTISEIKKELEKNGVPVRI